jgi:hypothetical protein
LGLGIVTFLSVVVWYIRIKKHFRVSQDRQEKMKNSIKKRRSEEEKKGRKEKKKKEVKSALSPALLNY